MLPLSSLTDKRDSKRPRLSGPNDQDMEDLNQLWKRLWQDGVNPAQEVTVYRGSDSLEDIDVPTTMKVLYGLPGLFAFNDVLIRDEYEKAWSIIEKRLSTHEALIVIGHPGIGMTDSWLRAGEHGVLTYDLLSRKDHIVVLSAGYSSLQAKTNHLSVPPG
jgi:hypothetical protein